MKGAGGALGYVLGTAIVVPLIFYLISIIFYAPNKLTKEIINQYVADSIIVKDDIGRNPSFDECIRSNYKIGFDIIRFRKYLDKNNTGSQIYWGWGYYSKQYNKYFRLTAIVEGGGVFDKLPYSEYKDIIITINKNDLNNPAYGNIDNPVPVFKFIGLNKSIRDDDKDYDEAYMDTIYHNNVEMYLKYIMPKKEFKARFGVK